MILVILESPKTTPKSIASYENQLGNKTRLPAETRGTASAP